MEKPSIKRLSASRIKTLENCSWLYWCNYELKLPQAQNSGASRGTVCHLVFELLLDPKHKRHYKRITQENSIKGSPAVDRLVVRHLKKLKIYNPEDYSLTDAMILVGLKHNFFSKGVKLFDPEYEFNIVSDKPIYNITGFIDKWGLNKKKKEIRIFDYKSSKSKFDGDDLDSNIQAMMYSLVAKKTHPDYRPIVTFIFLKFAESPEQTVEFSDITLEGFEHYLENVYRKINTFSYKDAVSAFAADKKKKGNGFNGPLLCGFSKAPGELKKDGNLKWACPYKFGFSYFVGLSDKGSFVKSAFSKEELEESNEGKSGKIKKIEERKYDGCPKFTKTSLTCF